MHTATLSIKPSIFPRWASLYLFYKNTVPNHRGKAAFLRFLHGFGLRKEQAFVWKMQNGMLLAISPAEGFAPWSVGWTCFEKGVWEPHIERTLRALLHPGDTAMDIGANIGYFSAVMARCVGPDGKVIAFEPVPSSFERLSLCRELNGLNNLTTLSYALGAEEREVEICYNPIIMGSASIYQTQSSEDIRSASVEMVRLDTLVARGVAPRPDLIKIDVEGHEKDVFAGAAETIRAARPAIIFEYNTETASMAGWNLADLTAILKALGPYRFYLLDEEAILVEIDPVTYTIPYGKYVDILADCGRVDLEHAKSMIEQR